MITVQQKPVVWPNANAFCRCLLCLTLVLSAMAAPAADNARKLKSSVPPEYPELARKLELRGTARVQATVAPDGTVTAVKELGGHPVLLDALTRAVKKWKYEPASKESLIEIKFDFAP